MIESHGRVVEGGLGQSGAAKPGEEAEQHGKGAGRCARRANSVPGSEEAAAGRQGSLAGLAMPEVRMGLLLEAQAVWLDLASSQRVPEGRTSAAWLGSGIAAGRAR